METLRVLVTDDEHGMRLGVRRVLHDLRIEVPDIDACAVLEIEEADCGETALVKIAQHAPDILILDHKMPGISGLDVLDQLAGQSHDLLTIMITAYASIETAVQAVKRGAYDFLAKPFTPDELRNTVKKAAVRILLAKQARRLADERSKVRLQFMRTLSHELQAPLNAIDGYLDLIKNHAAGEQLAAYDAAIQRSQERLAGMRRLIHDLLQMTAVESKPRNRELTRIDMVELARSTIELFQQQADAQEVQVALHRAEPLVMNAVEDELRMVLQNLVSNAIKYNRPGGEVHVNLNRNGSTVSIGVSDTGWGIPPTAIDRLCDEFVRIKTPHSQEVPGTGLGLSIVHKIARLYHGDIVIDSEWEVGSKFTVLLQDQTAEPTAHGAGSTQVPALAAKSPGCAAGAATLRCDCTTQ